MSRGKAWWYYKRESVRYGLYNKRLPLFLLFNVLLVVLIGSLLLFVTEKNHNPEIATYWDAIWCMFVSMATIGYGDVVPITAPGKVIVVICMILGIGALSTYITTLATRRAAKTKRRYSGMQGKTKSKDHVVICGWNSRGAYVVERLVDDLASAHRSLVLLADLEDSPVDDERVFFFRGSPSSENDLKRANISEASAAVLLADESKGGSPEDIDSRTVLAALTIRALNPTLKMTAEVINPENIGHLNLAKVGEILDSDVLLGNLIARSALNYGLIGIVTDMVTRKQDMRIFSLPVKADLAGKSCEEAAASLRDKHSGRLIGTMSGEGFVSYDEPYTLKEGDQLLIMGYTE